MTRRATQRLGLAVAVLCGFGLVGCGAPDLRAMRPTVNKPIADVLLVGQPLHWGASDVMAAAAKSPVNIGVSTVSASHLSASLQRAANNPHVGLIIVVQNGPVPSSEVSFASQHVSKRFDLFGSSAASSSGINVSQVVPDASSVAYAIGWLAGQVATASGSASIGWLTGGTSAVPQADVQIALAAAYTSDPNVTMTAVGPLNTATPYANSTGAGASTSNVLAGNTLGGVGATTTGSQPSIVVAARPLTESEWQSVHTTNAQVVSLCPQPLAGAAGAPIVPGLAAMTQALSDFTGGRWQAGVDKRTDSPVVRTDTHQVPGSAIRSVNQVELSIQGGTIAVAKAWSGLPQPLRTAFAPIAKAAE